MEFLDPKKRKAFFIRLVIGYILVAAALVLSTIILLYYAYGFGVNRNGEVIQNGLIFVSTRPRSADIYINGERYRDTTNTRVLMPAGQYTFWLERAGYRTWRRAINVEGGSVVRFDYPVLFPANLITTATKQYQSRPGFITQSPNRRWLLVQNGPGYASIESFDLNNVKNAPVPLELPASVLTLNQGEHHWEVLDWADDNRHVLLRHSAADAKGAAASEYVLLDRERIDQSVNLTSLFGFNPTSVVLRDRRYDRYFIYQQPLLSLMTATLQDPTARPYLDSVYDYRAYGQDTVLYATNRDAQAGKMAIKLYQGGKTYLIRHVAADSRYLLDIEQYGGDTYVVAGAPVDNRTYVYRNPAAALQQRPSDPLVPVHVLKTAAPTFVAFSANGRFVVAEQDRQFAVYDAETDRGYAYSMKAPLDSPQTHATWMDGSRLLYISSGSVHLFDFDSTNQQTLNAADPAFAPVFDRDYKNMYTLGALVAAATGGTETTTFAVNATALLTPQDQ